MEWNRIGSASSLPSVNEQREPDERAAQLVLLRARPLHDRGAPAGGRRRRYRGGGGAPRAPQLALSHLPQLDLVHPEAARRLRPQQEVAHRINTVIATSSYLLIIAELLLEPEHEHCMRIASVLKEPIVHVPGDLEIDSIDFNPLVPSEFPLQPLYLQNPSFIHVDVQLPVAVHVAVYRDRPVLAAEPRARRVDPVAEQVLSPQEQDLASLRGLPGLSLVVSRLLRVAHEERHFAIDDHRDVERGLGLGPGPELGPREVPKDPDARARPGLVGIELPGAVLLPKHQGLDMELKRECRGRRRERRRIVVQETGAVVGMEAEVEGAAEEGLGPGQGEEAEVGVVEAGGEVRVVVPPRRPRGQRGERRGRRRCLRHGAEVVGGGGPEARGEG